MYVVCNINKFILFYYLYILMLLVVYIDKEKKKHNNYNILIQTPSAISDAIFMWYAM